MMKKFTQWSLLTGVLVSAAQLAHAAPDYFRFEPGSVRVYRAQKGEANFTIRVGSVGFMHNGHVHYAVTGYGRHTLHLYRDPNTGALYHLNDEADVLVTSVEKGPGWFQANFRECDQEGQVQPDPVDYSGPSGEFTNALAIQYRAYGCADTGIADERYVEHLGMVQRTIHTFAGPVTYDLVHASIGSMTITEAPSTTFSVGVRRSLGPRVIANLRWNATGDQTVLRMPTSQEYEVVLRNSKGDEVWRWSTGKFFIPIVQNRSTRHLSYEVEIPLQVYGILLPEDVYTVEAWLTTMPERQFVATTSFVYHHPTPPDSDRRERR